MKNFVFNFIFGLFVFSLFSLNIFAQKLDYPNAKRENIFDTYHGKKVHDPYRWMENENSTELKSWIKSQENLFENFVKKNPLRLKIKERIADLSSYENYTASVAFLTPLVAKRNNQYFFIKRFAGTTESVLFRKSGLSAKPEILYELSKIEKKEKINLVGYEPSPNGKLTVLFFSKNNSRWLTLKLFDAANKKLITEQISEFHNLGGNVAWKADNSGFYYVKFEKQQNKNIKTPFPDNPKIYFHKIGSNEKDKLTINKKDNKNALYSIRTTEDGNYLLVNEIRGNNQNVKIYFKEINKPDSKLNLLSNDENSTFSFLGNKGSKFWLYTNNNAPLGKIVSVDVNNPKNWKVVIPESRNAITAGSSVGGNAIGMFGNRIVLQYTVDNNPLIRVFDLNGKQKKEIKLPSGGAIWGGFLGNQEDKELFYRYISITSPGTFYRLNLKTNKAKVFLEPELKINPNDFVTKQVFVKSKDRTRVPMFITHKKGLKLDSDNPTFMYGYGAFGWVATTWYQPHILTFIELGGVYALPGLRGGGEYGKKWHQSGSKINKQNSIDDYIASTEWLIKNKYTNPKKMIANGGSASSVTATIAVMQRPDLYGIAVIDIPILDMIRFGEFTNGRYWAAEFGSIKNQEEFNALYAISPYHQLKKGKCYPPTIITAGEKDRTALPLHAYKFTARLQNYQGCNNPILLKFMRGAGHNFGSTIQSRTENMTDELTFIFKVLDKK